MSKDFNFSRFRVHGGDQRRLTAAKLLMTVGWDNKEGVSADRGPDHKSLGLLVKEVRAGSESA